MVKDSFKSQAPGSFRQSDPHSPPKHLEYACADLFNTRRGAQLIEFATGDRLMFSMAPGRVRWEHSREITDHGAVLSEMNQTQRQPGKNPSPTRGQVHHA